MADLTADGQMDKKEFSIAMTLIKRKLQGYQIPTTLPPSMLVEPMFGAATLPGGSSLSSMGMMPGTGTLPAGMGGLSSAGFGMAPMSTATLPNRLPSQAVGVNVAPATALGTQQAPASPARYDWITSVSKTPISLHHFLMDSQLQGERISTKYFQNNFV